MKKTHTTRIYLDHASATPVDPRVASVMSTATLKLFGNPGAIHQEGMSAFDAIRDARRRIAGHLGAHEDEIIFTGSATESIGLAIFGVVRKWQRDHLSEKPEIIVSAVEHAAVFEHARELAKEGVIVKYCPIDSEGIVDCGTLEKLLSPQTVLVSIMYVNNEIGTIQPIAHIAKLLRRWRKENGRTTRDVAQYPLFHTDASQATTLLPIGVAKLGVDLLSLNAAKMYGPKGIGILWKKRSVALTSVIFGGGQEYGFRAGTEDASRILGCGVALDLVRSRVEAETARLGKLQRFLFDEIARKIPEAIVNGSQTKRIANNVHITIPEVDHEFVVIALDARGIAVSTKSACTEQEAEISHVISALREAGHGTGFPETGIRISMGRQTTKKELTTFVNELRTILDTLIIHPAGSQGGDMV